MLACREYQKFAPGAPPRAPTSWGIAIGRWRATLTLIGLTWLLSLGHSPLDSLVHVVAYPTAGGSRGPRAPVADLAIARRPGDRLWRGGRSDGPRDPPWPLRLRQRARSVPTSELILTVLGFNLVLILALTTVVALRFVALLNARDSDAGARLHLRFRHPVRAGRRGAGRGGGPVLRRCWSAAASIWWFSTREVQTVVENSATVARSYVAEQQRYIGDHVTLMGADLNRAAPGTSGKPHQVQPLPGASGVISRLPAAALSHRQGWAGAGAC